jgi:adenylate kinase family enzyme
MTTTNRYQRGKIYAIRSHLTEQIYIGSTCEPTLAKRMTKHRTNYRDFLRIGGSCSSSRFILEFGDAYIELIELFPCEFKDELTRREGELIRENNCVNKRIAGRTIAEWRNDNRESIKIKQKQWRDDNTESIKIKRKQYRDDNTESLKIKEKQYKIDNRESIKARVGQKITCSYCNTSFSRSSKSQHIKSKTHIRNYKAAYLECFGEVFTGTLDNQDY